MPRQKNTRPTSIYWLYDVRPEVIAAGWYVGKPFYCGKTVLSTEKRLYYHRAAVVTKSHGNVRAHVLECGDFIRIQTMEIVPVEQDWQSRERFWIRTLRLFHPDCLNIADGGAGIPGWLASAEIRAKMSDAKRGKTKSPEHCTKMSAARKGKKHTAETRAKISASNKGRKLSFESRAKMSVSAKGKKKSPEAIAKTAAAQRGRKHSAEARAKIGNIHRGKQVSAETRAKLSASALRRGT